MSCISFFLCSVARIKSWSPIWICVIFSLYFIPLNLVLKVTVKVIYLLYLLLCIWNLPPHCSSILYSTYFMSLTLYINIKFIFNFIYLFSVPEWNLFPHPFIWTAIHPHAVHSVSLLWGDINVSITFLSWYWARSRF